MPASLPSTTQPGPRVCRSNGFCTIALFPGSMIRHLLFALCLAQVPEFDVATFKPSPPSTSDALNIDLGTVLDGKLTLSNVTLAECIMFAYRIPSASLIFGPDWINARSVRYDIVAKAAPGTERSQMQSMLQTLLAQRLKLRVHQEQRPMQHLALVTGKNGPKLLPAEASARNPASNGHIARNQITMQQLATLLSRFERQVIVDETNLKGSYAVSLDWSQDGSGPSLYTAVQEQLGLKLDSRKSPVTVLVVDAAEKIPKENE